MNLLRKTSNNNVKNKGGNKKSSSNMESTTTTPDFISFPTMEQLQTRRSSMASSVADSVDYQHHPQSQGDATNNPGSSSSTLQSPVQRRASGPSNGGGKSVLNLPRSSMPLVPLEREDSWGNLSVSDL